MKVKDLIREEIDIDVWDNYDERCGLAIVGPLNLTEEGKAEFEEVLEMECMIKSYGQGEFGDCAVVFTDYPSQTEEESERKTELLRVFLLAQAGYVGVEEYEKWFGEV